MCTFYPEGLGGAVVVEVTAVHEVSRVLGLEFDSRVGHKVEVFIHYLHF